MSAIKSRVFRGKAFTADPATGGLDGDWIANLADPSGKPIVWRFFNRFDRQHGLPLKMLAFRVKHLVMSYHEIMLPVFSPSPTGRLISKPKMATTVGGRTVQR